MTQLQQSVLSVVDHATGQQEERIRACQQSNHLLCQGLIAFQQHRLDTAMDNWRQAIRLNPDNHEAQEVVEELMRVLPPDRARALRESAK